MGIFSKKPAAKKAAEPKKKAEKAAPEKSEEKKPAVQLPATTGDAHRVLLRPIVTEKSSAMASHGTYVFAVASDANKLEVKKAVKAVYGHLPTDVRIMNVQGKLVRAKTGYGRRKDWRKAIVVLKKGETIDVFAHA